MSVFIVYGRTTMHLVEFMQPPQKYEQQTGHALWNHHGNISVLLNELAILTELEIYTLLQNVKLNSIVFMVRLRYCS